MFVRLLFIAAYTDNHPIITTSPDSQITKPDLIFCNMFIVFMKKNIKDYCKMQVLNFPLLKVHFSVLVEDPPPHPHHPHQEVLVDCSAPVVVTQLSFISFHSVSLCSF